MEELVEFINGYGYYALFFYSIGGGMLALLAASFLSVSTSLDMSLIIVVAAISNFLGDMILFYVGGSNKEDANRMLDKYKSMNEKAKRFVKYFGEYAILIKKYIYGIRSLVPILFGIYEYSKSRFLIYNAMASIIWSTSVGYGGYYLGTKFKDINEAFDGFGLKASLAALLVLLLIYLFFNKSKDRD